MPRGRKTDRSFSGDLQGEVMAAMWKLGEGRVEDVRGLQPAARRSAYTTIQTVMNRLVERGVLAREKVGAAYVYRPKLAEEDYLSGVITGRLADASPGARQKALINIVGDLDRADLDELAKYANRIRRKRDD